MKRRWWGAVWWLLGLGVAHAQPTASGVVKLPALGADASQTSVSGLSSGAFMAVQLQVAYARSIVGAGVVAGGPYYCAANNVLFTGVCMGQVPFFPPNPSIMLGFAKDYAKARQIDALKHLSKRKVYVFSGTADNVVRQPAVDATVAFFQLAGVKPENLVYENQVNAGHAVITPKAGNDCDENEAPYINHCTVGGQGYDQAGAMLAHIYGPLQARVATPGGQWLTFVQRSFAPAATAMAPLAYAYVPGACLVESAKCRVHVALHGCVQSAETVGDQFVKEAGYNEWADNNQLIVLYPQVNKSNTPRNPSGCWDWWGYTGSNYAKRAAPQMKAIMAMVKQLGRPPAPAP
jgi:poly(3-hydroxybutyrate) depolymerase